MKINTHEERFNNHTKLNLDSVEELPLDEELLP
jgi:hypothetical protein